MNDQLNPNRIAWRIEEQSKSFEGGFRGMSEPPRAGRILLSIAILSLFFARYACAEPPRLRERTSVTSNAYLINVNVYYIKPAADPSATKDWIVFGQKLDSTTLSPEQPIIKEGLGDRGEVKTPTLPTIHLDGDRCLSDGETQSDSGGKMAMRGRNPGEVTRMSGIEGGKIGLEFQDGFGVPMIMAGWNGKEYTLDTSGKLASVQIGNTVSTDPTSYSAAFDSLITQLRQPIPYFEREPDGAFVKREAEAGMTIRCAILGEREEDLLSLKWKSTIKQAMERALIEGVSLNIGAPKITEHESDFTLSVPLRSWSILIYPAADGGHILNLVYARKERKES
jgi:hypothetical protein